VIQALSSNTAQKAFTDGIGAFRMIRRFECKIREETQQESGFKSSITEVYSTVLNSLWRQRGCYVPWNGQPCTP
jgi:hypothetical protein